MTLNGAQKQRAVSSLCVARGEKEELAQPFAGMVDVCARAEERSLSSIIAQEYCRARTIHLEQLTKKIASMSPPAATRAALSAAPALMSTMTPLGSARGIPLPSPPLPQRIVQRLCW